MTLLSVPEFAFTLPLISAFLAVSFPSDVRENKDVMYRGHLTLDGIARMSANSDYRNLYQAMVQARRFDTGSCSESCEIWGDQLELKFEEVGV